MNCPKCGSSHMSGPRYVPGSRGTSESLRHRCLNCGYSYETPTLDQKDPPNLPEKAEK